MELASTERVSLPAYVFAIKNHRLQGEAEVIVDSIEQAKCYNSINPGFEKAFNFLVKENIEALALGRHEIDGDDVFALVNEYETKSPDQSVFEVHREYIDVQYMVSGSEFVGYAPFNNQSVVEDYNPEHDYALYEGNASFVKMSKGMFAIFFPNDLHMPGVDSEVKKVRKIVIKVKV